MARIQTNLGSAHEPRPVDPGTYNLTIAEAELNTEKNYVRVSIGIDDHLDAPNITHFLSLPKAEDDERKASFKALMQKRFFVAFSIPHEDDGFDTEDFAGAVAEMEVGLTEPNANGNVYNQLVLPRIVEEAVEEEQAPPPPVRGRPTPAAAAAPTRAVSNKPAPRRR